MEPIVMDTDDRPTNASDNTPVPLTLFAQCAPSLIATDPRTRPGITFYSPQEGSEGSTVHVYLHTLHDLLAPPALSISLQFYSKRVDCMIQLLNDANDLVKQYAVSGQVPDFISTGYHS